MWIETRPRPEKGNRKGERMKKEGYLINRKFWEFVNKMEKKPKSPTPAKPDKPNKELYRINKKFREFVYKTEKQKTKKVKG